MKTYLCLLLAIGSLLLITACGDGAQAEPSEPFTIREARPTFTPTLGPNAAPAAANPQSDATPAVEAGAVNNATAANTTDVTSAAPANAPANPANGSDTGSDTDAAAVAPDPNIPTVRVVVNTQLVNARQGPGTDCRKGRRIRCDWAQRSRGLVECLLL